MCIAGLPVSISSCEWALVTVVYTVNCFLGTVGSKPLEKALAPRAITTVPTQANILAGDFQFLTFWGVDGAEGVRGIYACLMAGASGRIQKFPKGPHFTQLHSFNKQ